MAQWVLELRLSGASLYPPQVAANSAGGAYVICRASAADKFTVVKIDSAGAISWQRQYTLPSSGTPGELTIAANGSFVGVAVWDSSIANTTYVARLDGADGTVIWDQSVPFILDLFQSVYLTKALAVGSAGAIYIAGKESGTTSQHRLCKLAAADGAVTWAINPLDSAAAAFGNAVRQLEIDSAGNAIVSFIAENPVIQAVFKFANADGAVSWARKFAFPVTVDRTLCALDPSDNVYVAGWGSSAVDDIYVVKLTSGGSETWNKTITLTDTGSAVICGSMSADATNVYIGSYVAGGSSTRSAVIAMPVSGASAGGVAFTTPVDAFQDGAESVSAAGGAVYMGSYDVSTFVRPAIYKWDPATSGPANFGAYDRIGVTYSTATGTTTVSTITPTMPSNPTVTPAAASLTNEAGALLSTLYEEIIAPPLIRFAYSLFPAAQFGTPRWVNAYPATSIAPAAQFGTPALDLNLEPAAHSLINVSRFGQAYAFQYGADPGLRYAQALLPAAQFGTPAALPGNAAAATSLGPTAQFGVPLARLRQGASSLSPTAQFGSPSVRSRFSVAGFRSTAFGTPTLLGINAATGFTSTRFGTPKAKASGAFAASGFTSTNFGTPTMLPIYHAASLFNRSRFGTPRTVRPC